MTAPVYLVKGSDDVLRGEALSKLLDELVGTEDRSLVLDEFDLDLLDVGGADSLSGPQVDQAKLAVAIGGAQTLPFLTERRIVVVRRAARFTKAGEITALLQYLEDPLPTTVLVVVWEGSSKPGSTFAKLPPTLTKAITAAGGEVVDGDPQGRNIGGWVNDQFAEAGLDVDPRVRDKVAGSLGEDAGALIGLIERLKGAFAPGTRLTADDVEPFLGPAGGVPPWELTDAIDSGDVPTALDRLQRMMRGGDRHPLAIMATLQGHYVRMLRLDGSGVRSEKEAAQLLGMKGSTFPAKKALNQSRKLGGPGIRRAVGLLATADIDLKGNSAWPGELVMEVLVARLARLSRSSR
ncbi:DNA polymerase III subunit delta [Aquihabitans sp. G128]|uniref:DNA polymerase III subunit delta n=1 Tax=Aquihabitans sp. G128 TaxID=2849779 RepID=UPI001C231F5B|nr:DNA polymerase III subunit delta [Aquihabitans sp. G128]QXC61546.1 DNA polymerase III subunit delta [Aquihabitans sp. G128]